jgi:ATP-dependent exoDNAse (exonuclease V) beta subunit
MIKYSLLTSDSNIISNKDFIDALLKQGIKVLAFGAPDDMRILATNNERYQTARSLQTYPILHGCPVLTLNDGQDANNNIAALEKLAALAPSFNLEQYLIEHADAYNSLLVEAGAGTGKTTVMIDRILFLLHTVPDLSLEDIGMITFTNEATQNMKHKIQTTLMQRYLATHSPRYLQFLEDSAKIQIQTIHSFSKGIINELGTSIGYAHSLSLKSYKYQKKQIIHDVLNKRYEQNKKTVAKGLGAHLHDLTDLIFDFWTHLENIGLTDDEIERLDWGKPINADSKALHETLRTSFGELDRRYNELKMEEDSIAVGDIVRELRRILDNGVDVDIKAKKLKYLFVDEFQDSDNAQIKTIAWLHKKLGLYLFAVGDAKQSIYRFRGAVETAFDKLRTQLAKNTSVKPDQFTLIRNYRTSADVLGALDPIFRDLEHQKLLDYGKSLIPQKRHPGRCNIRPVRLSNYVIKAETIKTLRLLLADCTANANEKGTHRDATQRVTVLTRTNLQLSRIGEWCAEAGIPCYIQKEGTFYSSQAVRDFYCLVKAYLFPSTATHLFDYLNSSYSTINCSADDAGYYAPGSTEQVGYLLSLARTQDWDKYSREFKLKPVLSVLRKIIDDKRPVDRFIAKQKQLLQQEGQEDTSLEKQLVIEATQYEADLEKLLQILRKHFTGQMASLYHIYNFLQIHFLTDKTEDEPDISGEMDCGCVYGMTVHKAKGLEFDTVFLPFTHRTFRKDVDTELLLDERVDPPLVGWCKVIAVQGWNEVLDRQCNDHYERCLAKEFDDIDREEARLLYVALTRAIRRLECFVIGTNPHSWADMLEV